ncbi:MAG: TonB-dependent receptor, partial [Emcibacteraceae bacterium]|nr:TonB-dependent receptor [Emcibacteraceae bacterium]
IFYDENGLRTGEKDMDGSYRFRELTPSANLTYTFNNKSVLNLNGSYKPIFVQNDQIHIETGDDAETLFWDFEEDFFIWEVGGDYSITLGSLGKLKTLFLMNREYNADFLTDRFDGTGSQQYLYNKEIIDFQKHEDIFRTSLTRDLTPKQSLEVGGEASFNTIKQLFLNYERDIAVDPLELTTRNDIEVSEKRFEIFAHHNYTFSEKAVLQSSLTTEFSKITANTFLVDNPDIIVENNFTFFKPRFNFRYDLTKSDQYRLVAEKKISQLEFFHYFTFFDQQTKEIRKGNNDIKPEQIWEFSATYEHRLPNDAGTLEIKAFYHKYKDYIARADFTEYTDEVGNSISSDAFFALPPSTILRDDTDFSSKAGNVGDASVYGFEIKSNNRLSIIGLPDAHLNVGYKYRKPRYYDPFLQIDRQFSWWSEHEFSVDFRHDITDLKLSYGGGVKIFSDKRHTDINFDWKLNFSNIYEAFVEYKINDSIKLSIEGELPRGANQNAIFTRYRDHARFNELRGRNVQYNDRPVEIQFSLEGIF